MDGSHACFNFARSMVVRGVGGGQDGQLPTQVLVELEAIDVPDIHLDRTKEMQSAVSISRGNPC